MSRAVLALLSAFALVAVALVVVLVLWRPAGIGTTAVTQTVVDGFRPFASFRASDGPGTVFRITNAGETFKVVVLPVEVHAATEVTNNIRAVRKLSAEQLLKAVADDKCKPAGAGFNPQASGEVQVASVSGTREYTFDAEIDTHLETLRQRFRDKVIGYRPDDTYWVIRETIKTAEVDYSSSTAWLVAANAEADLRNCVTALSAEGKVNVKWDSSSQVSLSRKFEQPLRGWYAAERLTVELPFGAAPGIAVPDVSRAASSAAPAQMPDL
jgi:hypothetical protein